MTGESELSRYKLDYETPARRDGLERLISEVVRSLMAGRLAKLPPMPRFGKGKRR